MVGLIALSGCVIGGLSRIFCECLVASAGLLQRLHAVLQLGRLGLQAARVVRQDLRILLERLLVRPGLRKARKLLPRLPSRVRRSCIAAAAATTCELQGKVR